MTQKEKIASLKNEVSFLFEKEGRSRKYIAKLFGVKPEIISYFVKEWGLKEPPKSMKPSEVKFINRHKNLIKSRLDNNTPLKAIARELGVRDYYLNRLVENTPLLAKAKQDMAYRKKVAAQISREEKLQESSRNYTYSDLPNEIWQDILGYEGKYQASNMGRIRSHVPTHDRYFIMKQYPNKNNSRLYVHFYKDNKRKAFQVSRITAHTFVEGYDDKTANTVNHIDGNVMNNQATNLEWVSQSENNLHAYTNGRSIVRNGSTSPFKKIILDGKYEFKTVVAFARFIGKSETQARRYLAGETANSPYSIQIID